MASLSEIKAYLRQKKQVSLLALKQEFDLSAEDMQIKMLHFVKKGLVKETSLTANCGTSCNQCQPVSTLVYVWCEEQS